MESGWEEKKIQALFSELQQADELGAPRFATIWSRASIAPRRMHAFNFAFVGATALVFCAFVSLAAWSKYSQRTSPIAVIVLPTEKASLSPIAGLAAANVAVSTVKLPQNITRHRTLNATASHRAALVAINRKTAPDAKTLSSWQSPTAMLLISSSDQIFTSLPQLNQSSIQLKSFLPSRSN